MQAGDRTYEYNEWLYSVTCSGSSLECKDSRQINIIGWVTYAGIIACFLLSDMVDSFAVIKESFTVADPRGMFSGFLLLSVTILSIVASTIYIHATSLTNMAMIKDAVIALFLNVIDDQIYMIVCKISPSWIDQVQADIMNSLLANKEMEISEIVDVPSPLSEYSNPSHDDRNDSGKGNDILNDVLEKEPNSALKQYIQDQMFQLCRDRESELLALRKEIDESKEAVLGLRKGLDESKDETIELRKELEESKNEVVELRKEFDGSKDEVLALRKELDESKDETKELRKEFDESKDEVVELCKELDESKNEVVELRKDLDESENEVVELRKEFDGSNDEVLALRKELDESKDETKELRKELDESKD